MDFTTATFDSWGIMIYNFDPLDITTQIHDPINTIMMRVQGSFKNEVIDSLDIITCVFDLLEDIMTFVCDPMDIIFVLDPINIIILVLDSLDITTSILE